MRGFSCRLKRSSILNVYVAMIGIKYATVLVKLVKGTLGRWVTLQTVDGITRSSKLYKTMHVLWTTAHYIQRLRFLIRVRMR